MLGIKYDNLTSCKIDGWLKNTVQGLKVVQATAVDDTENKQVKLLDSEFSFTGVKVEVIDKSGDHQ